MSPKTVLGGGTIGSPVDAPSAADDSDDAPDTLAVRAAIARQGLAAFDGAVIAAASNVRRERVDELLGDEAAREGVWMLARPAAYIDATAAEGLLVRVLAALQRRETEQPWMLGATSLGLARELDVAEPLIARFLSAAAERHRIEARNGYFASIGFEPLLSADHAAFFDRLVTVDPAAPLIPVPFDPIVKEIRQSKIAGIGGALDTLIAGGKLVRVGEHLYRGEQIGEIRTRLVRLLRSEGRITAAQFRDAVGTSRKYIVPLLEFFDASGVTVRDGDQRTLRER
jgi:selenocysteine-specific elongation factor